MNAPLRSEELPVMLQPLQQVVGEQLLVVKNRDDEGAEEVVRPLDIKRGLCQARGIVVGSWAAYHSAEFLSVSGIGSEAAGQTSEDVAVADL